MVTKLELKNHGVIDTEDSVPMTMNFNLNDIRDISDRGGAFSKTIKIPGTQHNNSILGNIFNVNIQTLTSNPNVREDCRIIIDGLTVFEGVFQVRKINRKYKNSQDFKIEYECYIKSDTSSLYSDISGKYLTDLDLTDLDHIWTLSNLESNMQTGNWSDGYQYFLAYNPDDDAIYAAKNFIPAVYALTYFNQIFDAAGYTYEFGELFDIQFDKMIVPYNGDVYKTTGGDAFKFRAGIDSSDNYVLWSKPGVSSATFPPSTSPTFLVKTVPYNNVSNAGQNWFDNTNQYDIASYEYNIPSYFEGQIEFTARNYFDLVFQPFVISGGGNPYNHFFQTGDITYQMAHIWVGIDSAGNETILNTQIDWEFTLSGFDETVPLVSGPVNFTLTTVNYQSSYVFRPEDFPDVVTIRNDFRMYIAPGSGYIIADLNGSGPQWHPIQVIYADFEYTPDTQAHFTDSVQSTLVPGVWVYGKDLIPKKVKQSDFLLSLIKMYNLYLVPDQYNTKHIVIKTRDKFYDDGQDIDWTNRLDIKSLDVELISNKQSKRKTFTYKEDTKDTVSVAYKDETNEIYGQLEYIFENEFIKGIDKVEPIFSPTFILAGVDRGNVNRMPYIDSYKPANNIRIIYAGDYLTGYWGYRDSITNSLSKKYNYRYAGHLYPNPSNSTYDLNFGICDYYSHDFSTMTNNNLYNQHYYNQMDIFDNGHIMTAYFNLSYNDVMQLDLSSRIYVFDSWWNINKVIDFNLVDEKLTKVELITSDISGGSFTPNNNFIITESGFSNTGKAVNDGGKHTSSGNVFGSGVSLTEILGVNNVIQSNSSTNLLMGDDNNVQGSDNIVKGDNNKVNGDNVMVLGLNNLDITGSDITYTKRLVMNVDEVFGGDEFWVLDPFTDNIINELNGSIDENRTLGSYAIQNEINGGIL